ncbi:hypothetical protein ACM66B_000981 [Microbotryomycetes sp. NB124-2]
MRSVNWSLPLLAWALVGTAIAQRVAQHHPHKHNAALVDAHQHAQAHLDKDQVDPHVIRVIRETIVLGNGEQPEPTSALMPTNRPRAGDYSTNSVSKDDKEPANVLTTLGKLRSLQPIIVFAVHHPLRFTIFVLRSLPHLSARALRFAGSAFYILAGPVSWFVSWSLRPLWRFYDMLASLSTLWTFLGLGIFIGAVTGVIVAAITDMAPRDWFSLVGSKPPGSMKLTQKSNREGKVVEPNRVEAVYERTRTVVDKDGSTRRYSTTKPVPSSMVSDESDSDATETDSEGYDARQYRGGSFSSSNLRGGGTSVKSAARDPIEAWRSSSSSTKGGSSFRSEQVSSTASSTGMSRTVSARSNSTRSRYSTALGGR